LRRETTTASASKSILKDFEQERKFKSKQHVELILLGKEEDEKKESTLVLNAKRLPGVLRKLES
jgi:hypothetical protein